MKGELQEDTEEPETLPNVDEVKETPDTEIIE